MKTLETHGLAAGSLFKLLFIGLLVPIFIFSLGCGIAAFFGHATVSFNGAYLFGFKGLIGGTVLGLVLPILMAAFLWCLIAFGIWVWTRVRTINLTLKD